MKDISFWKGHNNTGIIDLIFNPNLVFINSKDLLLRKSLHDISPWESLSKKVNSDITRYTGNYANFAIESIFTNSIYMIMLGAINRLTSIFSSNLKLKVDRLKISGITKSILNSAITAIPLLILSFLGMPWFELASAELLKFSVGIVANFFSTRTSNFIREIDLLSPTKDSNLNYSTKRSFISSAINYSTTLLLDYVLLKKLGYKHDIFLDKIAHISLEFSASSMNIIGKSQVNARRIEYHLNEVNWFIGSTLVNITFSALSKLGFIKDMRRPFGKLIEIAEDLNQFPQLNRKQRKAIEGRLRLEREKDLLTDNSMNVSSRNRNASYDTSTTAAIQQSSASEHHFTAHEVTTTTTNRIKNKTRPNHPVITPEDNVVPRDQNANQVEYRVEIRGVTFFKIEGQGINNNTWAVVDDKLADNLKFERSLQSSGRIAPRSSLERLNNTQISIRPTSTGERAIGSIRPTERVLDTLNTIFGNRNNLGLAQLMDIQDILTRKGQDPLHIVYFDTQARNHDYNRAMALNAQRNGVGASR